MFSICLSTQDHIDVAFFCSFKVKTSLWKGKKKKRRKVK